jgi:hypothetical protein
VNDKTKKIAELNDLCRTAMGVAGRLFVTEGIAALPPEDQSAIWEMVVTFSEFSAANDPYAERNFGGFDHGRQKLFWKIDYNDKTLTGGSPDPT